MLMKGGQLAYNIWKIVKTVIAVRRRKKNCIWALVKHILSEQGPVDGSRDYTLDERIFHAPCIFVPDVSNPCRIEHSPNFPRRWNARERKALRFVYNSHCCNGKKRHDSLLFLL